MKRTRAPYSLSAGVGGLVAIWAALVHGRPAGGSLLAGCAFFLLGMGTVAVLRTRPHPVLSFLVLGGLYFLALVALRWVTGSGVGVPDLLGGGLYGLVLTWLLRTQGGRDGAPPPNARP